MAIIQEAIKRLRYVFTSEGADKVAADATKVGAAVVGSTTSQEKASLSLDKTFAGLERRYVAQIRNQQDYEKVQRTVNAAVAQHPELAGRANVVMGEAAQKYGQAGVAARAYAAATSGVSAQLVALSAGAGPVGTFLAALGPWGLAAAVGIGAAERAFSAMSGAAHDLAQKSEELRKFSEATGLSTDQLQALRSEASKFGVTSDEAQSAVTQFTARFQQLRVGEGELLTQIRRVNPALADQMAASTNAADALTLFGQALQSVDNIFQRNALVKAATGKGGITSSAFLSGLDVDKVTQSYIAAGKALDENLIRKLAQLNLDIAKTSEMAKQNISSIFAADALETELNFVNAFLRLSEAVKGFTPSPGFLTWAAWMLRLNPLTGGITFLAESINKFGASRPSSFDERFQPANDNPLKPGPAVPLPQAKPDDTAANLYAYNVLKDQIAAMGDAATAADRLRLAQMNLAIAGKDAGLSQSQLSRAAGLLSEAFKNQQAQASISALGSAATVTEQYAARVSGLRLELDKGNISQTTFNRAVEGLKVDQQLQSMRDAIAALGDMADDTEKYRLRLAELQQQLDQGRISQERFNQAAVLAMPGMSDAVQITSGFLKDFKNNLMAGKTAWESFGMAAQNVLNKIADILIDMAIKRLFANAFGNMFSGLNFGGPTSLSPGYAGSGYMGQIYHDGGAFDRGNVIPFARGGIVDRPTLFPMANGAGLMGEAGPEAVMPLRRMPNGRLGVEGNGGGAVHVNVEGTTIIVQGDANEKTLAEMDRRFAKRDRELPGKFINTYRQAKSRRII